MGEEYIPRIADEILKFKLRTKGAVWIRGAKWCGKSTTAKMQANTVVLMQDEDSKDQNIKLARLSPSMFLDESPPLLIDEWQVIPFIWNQIRTEVDRRNETGQFILTGSKEPEEQDPLGMHSGIGRITTMKMRPMSLFESRESSGTVSLEGLFNGESAPPSKCRHTLYDYAFFTARGGWPFAVGKEEDVALQQAYDYYSGLIADGLKTADGVRRDPDRVRALIRSYARNCASQANISTIKDDIIANDISTLSENTIHDYLGALNTLYVVEESEAWNPNSRSKSAIRTSNTRYFTDPSIACAALDLGPKALLRDLNTFELLFENLCVRDLRVYAERLGGIVKHYRDKSNLEVDAIITRLDGKWAAIEIKLGDPEAIELAVNNLLRLKSEVNGPGPEFLMVLTTTNVAYLRDDGVWIVPLGCLGP